MKSSERFGIIRRAATVILVFVVMTAVMAGCKISNTSLKKQTACIPNVNRRRGVISNLQRS